MGGCWSLFAFAHLAFCAAAIFARPSELIVLRLRAGAACGGPRFEGAARELERQSEFEPGLRIATDQLSHPVRHSEHEDGLVHGTAEVGRGAEVFH
jgi:hypothetical protein